MAAVAPTKVQLVAQFSRLGPTSRQLVVAGRASLFPLPLLLYISLAQFLWAFGLKATLASRVFPLALFRKSLVRSV